MIIAESEWKDWVCLGESKTSRERAMVACHSAAVEMLRKTCAVEFETIEWQVASGNGEHQAVLRLRYRMNDLPETIERRLEAVMPVERDYPLVTRSRSILDAQTGEEIAREEVRAINRRQNAAARAFAQTVNGAK